MIVSPLNCCISPLIISIAIWYCTRPGDYNGDDNYDAPAVQEGIKLLCDNGLLVASKGQYMATEGLGVWVNALCNVPFPIQIWAIPE